MSDIGLILGGRKGGGGRGKMHVPKSNASHTGKKKLKGSGNWGMGKIKPIRKS